MLSSGLWSLAGHAGEDVTVNLWNAEGVMDERELRRLSREESLRLLSDAAMGRVVFTQHALPAIQPVNHVIDDGDIIIRTHLGAAITLAVDGHDAVVAYEADA